jgi:predicted DNA repair protein MutK
MSIGLTALIDDVVGLAKLAAASLDDATAQATRAGVKAAGIVVDDAAVTPRYVVGFLAARELPIVGRIAWGSLRNKLLILLPAALALSLFAPWLITPLLMLGGAYLCYEGAEKVIEIFWPHAVPAHAVRAPLTDEGARQEEEKRVRGAIRTDLILSAEIMAITLASVADSPFWTRVFVLAIVGIGITALVYGAVAVIVKADDVGVALTRSGQPAVRVVGRFIVRAMPPFLKLLGLVGTAAMLWVGGGIVLHGLEQYGWSAVTHGIHDMAHAAGQALGGLGGIATWLVSAAASGLIGLGLGAVIVPLVKLATPAAHGGPAPAPGPTAAAHSRGAGSTEDAKRSVTQ